MKLAILGAGKIAGIMADTICQLNRSGCHEVELYAVASRDLERAQALAEQYQIPLAFGSYEAMLKDPQVELVYIATPHSHHYQHIRLCADHSKHILCEKAFTVTAQQAKDAIAYTAGKGLLIAEAIWTRYQPMRQLIQDTLHSGVIGQPRLIAANLCYPVAHKPRITLPELAGGALLDLGIYPLNFAEMVFGPAQRVQGSCIYNQHGMDMTDSITLTWADGRVANLTASVLTASDRSGVIYGDKGYLVVENINNPQGLRIYNTDHELISETRCPTQLTGYEYEVLEAVHCIQQGLQECPSMPHSETIHMMEVMDELRAQMGIHFPCEGLAQ